MEGKWIGKYWFLGNVPETLKNKETEFEIKIDDFKNNRISGSVFDIGGTAGIGTISGTVKRTKIKFTKKMPVKTSVFPDGSRIEEQKPHRPIYYEGIINYETDTIEGTWKFKKGIGIINRKIVFYPGTKGKWKMKRV